MSELREVEKPLLQCDMDGVVADYDAHAKATGTTHAEAGFFLALPLIDGALDAIHELEKHFRIRFCSTAPWSVPSSAMEKRQWIEINFPEIGFKALTITHHKEEMRGAYLIDDRTKNGAAEFGGEHIHFGTDKFPDWEAVLKYLIPK